MASVNYHVVVTFDRNEEGDLVAGKGVELPSMEAAGRIAKAMSLRHAGAIAFSRTGNPATGEFSDSTVIVSVGDVDLNAVTTKVAHGETIPTR